MNKRFIALLILSAFMMSGCGYAKKIKKYDGLESENANLRNRISALEDEKRSEVERVVEEKDQELSELERAKRELEESLKKEIGDYKAKLEMTERGLVITFVSEVFFDSGKDLLKEDGKASLQKVAEVLNADVPDSNVAVEGHTDNDPIKYSAWKSNWELSSARALAVLHYIVEDCKVAPGRLSANGYGEFKPVASNDTLENKQKNRRVEIVILPAAVSKVKA